MKRRSFLKNSTILPTGIALGAKYFETQQKQNPYPFRLKYAPHLGMFKHHAGEDPIDQINFMADIGFKAYEDNGMKGREATLQNDMASTMSKRDIEMGVFVAHKIYWKEPTLAKGDQDSRSEFLDHIKD